MNKDTKNILAILMWLGATSILSFSCLLLHIPFVVSALFSIAVLIFVVKYFKPIQSHSVKPIWLYLSILLVACYFINDNISKISTKHGLWDAWAIWNLHAKYLSSPEHWQAMFVNVDGAHPDYPIALPSLVAFIKNCTPNNFVWISTYLLHALITISIPFLVFTDVYNKNKIFATIAVFIVAANLYYFTHGVSQFADTLLALFFLCAIICLQYVRENSKMVALAAFFLGMCMFTKNEGVIIAVITILFNLKVLLKKGNTKYFLYGIIPAVVALVIFKSYSPSNDVIAAQNESTFQQIFDTNRYRMIYDSFVNLLNEHFRAAKYGLILYALLCLFRRQLPNKYIVMILTIFVVYMGIYVISHQDLEWHLFTSQGRLMHQLYTPLLYVLALEFAKNATVDIVPSKDVAAL